MNPLNMPLCIVAAFLALTLVVGIYFSITKTTFREYAIGNKQFSTATLVATVLATLYGGGGLIREVSCVHTLGLWWIILGFLDSFGLLMISRLAFRMGPFMEHLSMAETIGNIYGRYPRVMAALIGICSCTVMITIQINVISQTVNMCLGPIDSDMPTIIATLLLIFYSSFGGIRAVTLTDVLQFLTFSIIIPLLCWLIFLKIGKPVTQIIPILQSEYKFQFSSVFHFDLQLVGRVLLLFSFLISYVQPQLMQRVYMASDPVQARKVFSYATIFNLIIGSFITLVALFVFVGAPDLPKEEIWAYVVTHIPPAFKGFFAISLLAMAMSTADSCLNACAVMVSHDIVKSIELKKEIADAPQLKAARWTTLVVGLLAMRLALHCQDLLQLMYWGLDCVVPIVAAPFILAVFGFRGTARTALIGMTTGLLAILAWNRWVEPLTEIDGSFLAMLANALAMMAAHYLLKQPKLAGWVEPDSAFKQMQQENARRSAERNEAIKNAWNNRKITLIKLTPTDSTFRLTGLYIITTAILGYWFIKPEHIYWPIFQGLIGALFTSSKTFFNKTIPTWCIGLCWLIGLAVYLPLNLLWHWWHFTDPIFTTCLSLAHFFVILWLLPLYLGIGIIGTTLLVAIYPIYTGWTVAILCSLLPLFIVSLLIFAGTICLKVKLNNYITKNIYLKDREGVRDSRKFKESLYDAAIVSPKRLSKTKGYGFVLSQVVRKVEESISFLDNNTPLFKEDFQSIINKLYDWVAYFNKREMAKHHALLQPTKITLDKLMRKVEVALSQEMVDPPKLLVEKIIPSDRKTSFDIICDINQVVYSLVKAILSISRSECISVPVVSIQLHPTSLQFKEADSINNSCPVFMHFHAIALVITHATVPSKALPKVKPIYGDTIDGIDLQRQKGTPPSIDLEQDTISSMVSAHYGYWEATLDKKQPAMLLVIPNDVTDIRDKMTVTFPIDCLTSETPITPKEQADSMMTLMKFYDHVCKSICKEDPIDLKTISGLILLLRQHFGFKRHASGQLFYVRAVGITQLVVDWVFHSPKVIYASLLYELVCRTCLPLSYIKEHYNLGVYAFVSNIVKINKRQDLNHPSLLYVQNRLEKAIQQDHVQLSVLFIKLAERLYDLRHVGGYIHLTEVQHMAQETLAIDVQIANEYLGPEIGEALEIAAKEALKISKHREEDQENDR